MPDADLYRARAQSWREKVVATLSDDLRTGYIGLAEAYERLAASVDRSDAHERKRDGSLGKSD